MPGGRADVPVLTYHAISEDPGPTCIPPTVFRAQMQALADLGYRALTLAEFLAWREEGGSPGNAVLITFDDGFTDFADVAHPILRDLGFSAVVFLPTGKLGGREDWDGPTSSHRPIMDWPRIEALAAAGVEFGGHGVLHLDLTGLAPAGLRDEVRGSGEAVAEHLGRPTLTFAQPFGATNATVEAELAQVYRAAFGTRLACADLEAPAMNLPRIDMHYFRDIARWRAFLAGSNGYLAVRQALRAVRETLQRRRAAPAQG